MCLRLEYPNEPVHNLSFFSYRDTGQASYDYGTETAPSKGTSPYPTRLIGAVLMECSDLLLVGKKTLNINIFLGCGGWRCEGQNQ